MTIYQIDGRTWRTPLTAQAPADHGTARLRLSHYRGIYHHEGVDGFEFYQTKHWLPVVRLEQRHGRRWETWMVDDPKHWNGMREAVADLPPGRILVAGLGLGLMLHHMAVEPRFTAITVVEANPDVVALIQPTLPADPRVRIQVGDFYHHIEGVAYFGLRATTTYDAVLWDLAVGTPDETRRCMLKGWALVGAHLPGVPLVQFGVRRQRATEGPPLSAGGTTAAQP
jgi:hypothetical protein